MQHLAIMKKSWGFIDKILNGQKTIESRWYLSKRNPWGNIKAGEIVYFKDSGGLVRAKAEVEMVKQYEILTPDLVKDILLKFGVRIGLVADEIPKFIDLFKDKKYCILIFIKKIVKIKTPFDIDKKGFGVMSAWISCKNIIRIKR